MLTPEIGMTVALVRSKVADLGPRERAVAEVFLADPGAAGRMTAAEIGALAGTSAATVTRACQSIGFTGFPHLRQHLIRDSGAQAVRDDTALSHPVQKLYAEAARDLDAAAASLDVELFDRCADTVAAARRVVLIGSGSSVPTASSAMVRFHTVGVPTEVVLDPPLQVLVCNLLTAQDVVIAISDSGENEGTLAGAASARRAGARVLAVTSFPRSRLSQAADSALIVGSHQRPWPESLMTSPALQALLLNALAAEAGARRGAVTSSGDLDAVLKAFTGSRRPQI